MKLWINFEGIDINKREKGWAEGDDFEDQLIYESEQDMSNCNLEFGKEGKVTLHFDNGYIEMTKEEFGRLFT